MNAYHSHRDAQGFRCTVAIPSKSQSQGYPRKKVATKFALPTSSLALSGQAAIFRSSFFVECASC
jgi:hypothetical protein